MASDLRSKLDSALRKSKAKDYAGAIEEYRSVLATQIPHTDEILSLKENAAIGLAKDLGITKQKDELAALLEFMKPVMHEVSKARAAKIVKAIVDALSEIPNSNELVVRLCRDMISWAEKENNSSLRHRLETKLALALYNLKQYNEALAVISKLLREIKRLDDKPLLVEIHLLESKINHSLNHLPKSRAALTAARTAANAIYCPPLLQAELDVQSGTLHCDEKDYKIAYSYFFEAFENYSQANDPRSIQCMKYMLLCKIMTNIPDDVQSLINGKLALKFASSELEAMRAVAKAHANSSLKQFQEAINQYQDLKDDPLIHRHLNQLYDTLLEQNLLRIIEPFSQVEIAHVAELIELPVSQIEKKLSQMILDKKLDGILDQGTGCLTVFDDPPTDGLYTAILETIGQFDKVVSNLYNRATKLSV